MCRTPKIEARRVHRNCATRLTDLGKDKSSDIKRRSTVIAQPRYAASQPIAESCQRMSSRSHAAVHEFDSCLVDAGTLVRETAYIESVTVTTQLHPCYRTFIQQGSKMVWTVIHSARRVRRAAFLRFLCSVTMGAFCGVA